MKSWIKKLENFGKDENGQVYLIDFGELIYINDYQKLNNPELFYKIQYQKFIERELKYHALVCSDLNNKFLSYLNSYADNYSSEDIVNKTK